MSTNTTPLPLLNGHMIQQWQRGRRLFAIEHKYRYLKWHPTALFSAMMRRAVYQLSNGGDVVKVTSAAIADFLAAAKYPGMDTIAGTDTYKLAMDLCATMRSVLEYISRLTLLTLHHHAPVMTPEYRWGFLSYPDDSGVLHKWQFVDRIDQDALYRVMHSWAVMGDLVFGRVPMVVHFVAIGQTRDSRRQSPWCKAYSSPAVAGVVRFQKRSGTPLEGAWKPVYLADDPRPDARAWVDKMLADNVTEPLVRHIDVKQPTDKHVREFMRDLDYEHTQMLLANVLDPTFDPMTLPMCRSACDTPYPCPHQFVCYSNNQTLDACGLYGRIPVDRGPSASQSASEGTTEWQEDQTEQTAPTAQPVS